MLAESRTTIKSWIERIVGSGVSVYCDFVPDHDSNQSVVCFNLQDVELIDTYTRYEFYAVLGDSKNYNQFEKSRRCRCSGRQSTRSKFR